MSSSGVVSVHSVSFLVHVDGPLLLSGLTMIRRTGGCDHFPSWYTRYCQMRRRSGRPLCSAVQALCSEPSLHIVRDQRGAPCFVFPDTLAPTAPRIASRWSAVSPPPGILSPRFTSHWGGPGSIDPPLVAYNHATASQADVLGLGRNTIAPRSALGGAKRRYAQRAGEGAERSEVAALTSARVVAPREPAATCGGSLVYIPARTHIARDICSSPFVVRRAQRTRAPVPAAVRHDASAVASSQSRRAHCTDTPMAAAGQSSFTLRTFSPPWACSTARASANTLTIHMVRTCSIVPGGAADPSVLSVLDTGACSTRGGPHHKAQTAGVYTDR